MGAPHLTPLVAPLETWVPAKPASGAEHTSDRLPGRTRAPPGPPPTGRPVYCLRSAGCRPAACTPGAQDHRPAGPLLAAAPAASFASMIRISASPRGAPVDLPESCAQSLATATPATEKGCARPPACPPSSFPAPPQSAPGPAAQRHRTEDPRPGPAPRRSCPPSRFCSAPGSAPRQLTRGRGSRRRTSPEATCSLVTPG